MSVQGYLEGQVEKRKAAQPLICKLLELGVEVEKVKICGLWHSVRPNGNILKAPQPVGSGDRKETTEPKMLTQEELESIFTYHPPKGDQTLRYQDIRAKAYQLAAIINDSCPPSPQGRQALLLLQQSVMMANASIACNE